MIGSLFLSLLKSKLYRMPIKPLRGFGPGSNPSIKKNESRVRLLFLSIPEKYVKMNSAFQHILGRYGGYLLIDRGFVLFFIFVIRVHRTSTMVYAQQGFVQVLGDNKATLDACFYIFIRNLRDDIRNPQTVLLQA